MRDPGQHGSRMINDLPQGHSRARSRYGSTAQQCGAGIRHGPAPVGQRTQVESLWVLLGSRSPPGNEWPLDRGELWHAGPGRGRVQSLWPREAYSVEGLPDVRNLGQLGIATFDGALT